MTAPADASPAALASGANPASGANLAIGEAGIAGTAEQPGEAGEATENADAQVTHSRARDRARGWYYAHKASLLVLGRVLAVVGLFSAWNMQGWPGRVDDDEGTYVAEAWAMVYQHHLSHYTYWYDHPPLGWAQLAAYIRATGGFHWYPSAIMVGREFMWWVTLASCALLFVLCRRLGFRRTTAAVTVLLFALSPLAVYYHRMVSLDNIGMVWLLAALVVAASRRHSLAAAFWSAVCMAVAVLSKETLAILLPVVVWVLWQHSQGRTRKWHLGIFAATFVELVAFYPLFAALRGELIPGAGHVSLGWAMWWQVLGRTGSGSLFDGHSQTHGLVVLWMGADQWLIATGMVLVPAGLLVRRLRPAALGMLIQVAMLLTGGYVPYFYVTAMLPFAALLAGGVADTLWGPVTWRWRVPGWLPRTAGARKYLRYSGRVPVAAATVVLAALVAPQWGTALVNESKVDGYAGSLAATDWVKRNLPRDAVIVVDDYMWLDLKLAGMNPLWAQKTDTDPQTSHQELPHGWRSVQYVVLTTQISGALAQLPVVAAAVSHSVVVKSFADGVTVRRVIPA